MIFWLREKMKHWAEERAKEADVIRRVEEYKAKYPDGYTEAVCEYIMVDGEMKTVSSQDPAYPRDKFPRMTFTTMSGDSYNTGDGDGMIPIPLPKGE